LPERIAAAGINPEDILQEAGLRRRDLAEPGRRIALAQYCRAFELAARRTARTNFGLEFGATFHPQHLGLLGYLAISAPTLGQALRKFAAYLPAHQQATHVGISAFEEGSAAVEYVILDSSIRERQQDAELSIGMLFSLLRHCLGSRWSPIGIHLMHDRPRGRTRYEELLGVRPLFAQSSNRILLRRGELDCPMPRRDEQLMRLIEAELRKQLPASSSSTDVLARARHEIALALDSAELELDAIASRCGLQSWTLKRRLKEQGMTFQDLVAATRYDLALEHFARGVPITNVAIALGYSEVSAFSRAFRQWTGQSPRKFLAARGAADSRE
jgi:AraC-like DNA-binding protein